MEVEATEQAEAGQSGAEELFVRYVDLLPLAHMPHAEHQSAFLQVWSLPHVLPNFACSDILWALSSYTHAHVRVCARAHTHAPSGSHSLSFSVCLPASLTRICAGIDTGNPEGPDGVREKGKGMSGWT